VAEMTDDERRLIQNIWNTMSGGSRQIDVLYDIANGRCVVDMAARALMHQINLPNNGLGE
jgi:hypothetical protein